MKGNKGRTCGMGVLLRVIVMGVVLMMIAMTLLWTYTNYKSANRTVIEKDRTMTLGASITLSGDKIEGFNETCLDKVFDDTYYKEIGEVKGIKVFTFTKTEPPAEVIMGDELEECLEERIKHTINLTEGDDFG